MNFTANQQFTLTTDDHQTLTYTVQDIAEDGRLLVQSSLMEKCYFVSPKAFEDFLRVIGWQQKNTKYRIYFINHQYYSDTSYDYINEAIKAGKEAGFEFRVELGSMVCCAWDSITGLRFYKEYQAWKRDQEVRLAQVEGSYP